MDVNTILEVFEEKKTQYFTFSGEKLYIIINVPYHIRIF